ncbi:hypothetical protein RB596_003793 [Gaeumannomyces avenae]
MTRAQQTISIALLASSVRRPAAPSCPPAVALRLIALTSHRRRDLTQIVPVLPFWFIVAFGAMLLARLGWGVLTFNDTPEAYKELMVEIEEAKVDLQRRGVDVD